MHFQYNCIIIFWLYWSTVIFSDSHYIFRQNSVKLHTSLTVTTIDIILTNKNTKAKKKINNVLYNNYNLLWMHQFSSAPLSNEHHDATHRCFKIIKNICREKCWFYSIRTLKCRFLNIAETAAAQEDVMFVRKVAVRGSRSPHQICRSRRPSPADAGCSWHKRWHSPEWPRRLRLICPVAKKTTRLHYRYVQTDVAIPSRHRLTARSIRTIKFYLSIDLWIVHDVQTTLSVYFLLQHTSPRGNKWIYGSR